MHIKLEIGGGDLNLWRDGGEVELQKGAVHLITGITAEVEVGRATVVGVGIVAVDKGIAFIGIEVD